MAREQSQEAGAALEAALSAQEAETEPAMSSTVEVKPDEYGDGQTYTLVTSIPRGITARKGANLPRKVFVQWWLVPKGEQPENAAKEALIRTDPIEVPRALWSPDAAKPEEGPDDSAATQGFLAASAENPLVATLDVTDLAQGEYDVLATFSREDER